MAKQSYALEAGGPRRLEVAWKGLYKDLTLTLDGAVVGTVPDQKALVQGQEFRLLDGSTLKIKLVQKLYSTELQVLRNGQPLPGSMSDPQTKLKNAYTVVYFVAGLNLLLGILSWALDIKFLQELGNGFASLLFGLVFLGLGYFVQRKSSFALIVAIVLMAIDALGGLVLAAMSGSGSSVGGLFARIILMIPMIQGVAAIKTLKAQAKGAIA